MIILLVGKNQAEELQNKKLEKEMKKLILKNLELHYDRELQRIQQEMEFKTKLEKKGII